MGNVTICVRTGTPEQEAVNEWLKRYPTSNEGCGCCVDIYFVNALPYVLADLPPGAIVSDSWKMLNELEREYCRCLVSHLSDAERLLLENVLDAHDRLWDGVSSADEVYVLYSAIADTLRLTIHFTAFEPAVTELARLLQSGLPDAEIWDRARACTYDLRLYSARQLNCAVKSPA